MFALLPLLLVVAPIAGHGHGSRTGTLSAGTPFETPWYEHRAEAPGPTVLVLGGMHGDEPAGAEAAAAIACWEVGAGRLVVVPRANPPALAAGSRRVPGLGGDAGDLNRAFPPAQDGLPHARALWELVLAVRPDWLLDLHEGYAVHRTDPESVGRSVIASRDEAALELAAHLVRVGDSTLPEGEAGFSLLRSPVAGSLAQAAWEGHGVRSAILETTTRGGPLSVRAARHRALVAAALEHLGLDPRDTTRLVPRQRDRIAVALYDDAGTSSPDRLTRQLAADPRLLLRRIGAAEIHAGLLPQFDALLHPGGSGSRQGRHLGEPGRHAVREFVAAGGGYVGLGAGAYLAASNYDWSLALLDVDVVDRAHWRRGTGRVDLELTPAGAALLAAPPGSTTDSPLRIEYANGPLYAPASRPDLPDVEVLAHYRGELADHGAPRGIMPRTPAIVRAPYGQGRALAFSPHPDRTPGLTPWLPAALRWTARRDGR